MTFMYDYSRSEFVEFIDDHAEVIAEIYALTGLEFRGTIAPNISEVRRIILECLGQFVDPELEFARCGRVIAERDEAGDINLSFDLGWFSVGSA